MDYHCTYLMITYTCTTVETRHCYDIRHWYYITTHNVVNRKYDHIKTENDYSI